MVELPETYVLAGQIDKTLVGKTILCAAANTSPHKFAWFSGDPAAYNEKLAGRKITASRPGTGYTCGGNTEISCEDALLVISTPIRYHAPGEKLPAKHQLCLIFDDQSAMTCTVRMWGAMLCYEIDENGRAIGLEANRNPTPLEPEFDENYFEKLIAGADKKLSAKAFLATEQRIPGLGNGVLRDILFNARVNPKTRLEKLSDSRLADIYRAVKDTLANMAAKGGRDTEKDLFCRDGGYKTILSDKTFGTPCPACGSAFVREAYLGGTIYYCPTCQPWIK